MLKEKIVNGRVYINIGKRGGYYPKFRWIWEQENGSIPKGYCIHHIDENKLNDDITNLKLMTQYEHRSWHGHHNKESRRKASKTMKEKGRNIGKLNGMYGKHEDNPDARIVRNIDTGEIFLTIKDAIEKYPLASNLVKVCTGERDKAGGFRWEYADNKGIRKRPQCGRRVKNE